MSLRAVSSFRAPALGATAFVRRVAREAVRVAAVAVGALLIGVGLILAVLPGHLGLPLLVVGLILVLRNSPKARRRFVTLQRRHPRVVFPVRRLIRREPEVFPVLWQQVLRLERGLVPLRWRRAGSWRRRYLRPRRD
ncbi:MAG: hypothetical protein JO303_19110 [Caulobacteraceae bacterium]|nr:hypothetical protein [Caulobacteraceae bacterium]